MDWLGAVLQLFGRWKLVYLRRSGFIWCSVGKLLWFWWSIELKSAPLAIIMILSILFDIKGWLYWGDKLKDIHDLP